MGGLARSAHCGVLRKDRPEQREIKRFLTPHASRFTFHASRLTPHATFPYQPLAVKTRRNSVSRSASLAQRGWAKSSSTVVSSLVLR